MNSVFRRVSGQWYPLCERSPLSCRRRILFRKSTRSGLIFIPQKYKIWVDIRKQLKLSHTHIQMARELGLNPKNLPRLANTGGARWKQPLPEYIVELYYKAHSKERPGVVRSIEQMVKDQAENKRMKSQKKAERKAGESAGESATPISEDEA